MVQQFAPGQEHVVVTLYDKMPEMQQYQADTSIKLPEDYRVYCLFVSGDGKRAYENWVIDQLNSLVKTTSGMYVVKTGPEEIKYIDYMDRIGFMSRPALLLTDDPRADVDSFIMIIDDAEILNNAKKLNEIVSFIIDYLFEHKKIEPMKSAIENRHMDDLIPLCRPIAQVVESVKPVKVTYRRLSVDFKR